MAKLSGRRPRTQTVDRKTAKLSGKRPRTRTVDRKMAKLSGISALDPDGGQKNGETVRDIGPRPGRWRGPEGALHLDRSRNFLVEIAEQEPVGSGREVEFHAVLIGVTIPFGQHKIEFAS